MIAVQMDFWKTPLECELDALRIEMGKVKESSNKVRKGTYARLNELEKKMLELEVKNEILEKGLCYGK